MATVIDRSDEDEALYDPLTGLPGRLLQRAHLVHALRRAGRNGTRVAVLFLDIDDFHDLNERHGSEVADQVLIVLAGRIEAALRNTDMTSRLDADEFVIVCEDVPDDHALQLLRRRLLDATATPVQVGGCELAVRVTVGTAVGGGNHRAGALLNEANRRMLDAKGQRPA